MKKNILFKYITSFLVIIILVAHFNVDLNVYAEEKNKEKHRILFLSAYLYERNGIGHQLDGVLDKLSSEKYILDYEFMDAENREYDANYEGFYNLLKFKMDDREPYDGIIVTDEVSFDFVTTRYESLFSEVPVVFLNINEAIANEKIEENPFVTGVYEKNDYEANLRLATSLFPNMSEIVLFYNGEEKRKAAEEIAQVNKGLYDYHVTYVDFSDFSEVDFMKEIRTYDKNNLMYIFSIADLQSKFRLTGEELFDLLTQNVSSPIFGMKDEEIGRGAIGGQVINQFMSGQVAGEMMQSILETGQLPKMVAAPETFAFNYDLLRKFDIPSYKLPEQSFILNKPETLFQKYGLWIIYSLALGLLVLLIIIYYRGLTNKKLKESNKKLLIAEADLKEQYERNQKNHEELVKQEAYIRHQAEHDYLTNLPNRSVVMDKLEAYAREDIDFTVFIVDFNDFKELNDTYGHQYGDATLEIMAVRLLNLTEKNDGFFVSRFGSDEFLIILRNSSEQLMTEAITEIKRIFKQPVVYQGIENYITMSMGVAHSKHITRDVSDAISNAHIALYEAKKERMNTHVIFDPRMRDKLEEVKKVREILKEACDDERFNVLYQPQIDVATKEVAGYEALVRMKDHNLSPAQFIPIAEESDLIFRIGRIVTKKVIEQLVEWREKGMTLSPVSINFCTRQIRDEQYVTFLRDLLEKHSLSPSLIEIEFTESIFINSDKQALKLFEEFKKLGVGMALDDFGTGYSSISYLTYIPVQKVKVDKSLVDIFLQDEKDAFIKHLIRLFHTLDLSITAEGVEDAKQYKRLKEFGCDYIQGYYFSKPITGEEVESFVVQ